MVGKRRTKILAVLTSIAMAAGVIVSVPSSPSEAASVETSLMFRLYNPNSGEHFYTADESERDNLESYGWKYEGVGWYAPTSSNTPVYRLYNPNTGDHLFTTSTAERQNCLDAGWNDENIGWYSDDAKSIPVYREYNPNAATGTHNYTSNKSEHDYLVSLGWADEGIGWYGITPPSSKYVPGDTVILGSYEQDNDPSNGAEPIEWEVLGIKDGHTLILSKYALDCKQYNESWADVTWEDCTLRSWLNDDFYNTAFSSSDMERIVNAHNENPDSYEFFKPWNFDDYVFGAEGGNATNDNVFLLSWKEAEDYLDGKLLDDSLSAEDYNQKLLCRPTDHAKAQGVWTSSDSDDYYSPDTEGCCLWWLRSPGIIAGTAADVADFGVLNCYYVHDDVEGVRPALLID